MRIKGKLTFDARALVAAAGPGRTTRDYQKSQPIFAQGDRADAVFFVHRGKVKLTVLSRQGKQAVIALLGPGDFFGEGCLAGQPVRMATPTALTEASVARLPSRAPRRREPGEQFCSDPPLAAGIALSRAGWRAPGGWCRVPPSGAAPPGADDES